MPNPFAFGSPVSGDHFDDRLSETAFLVRRLTSGQNVVVTSPRRYGKTSLLLRSVEEARREHQARVAVASLLRCSTRQEVAEEVTRAVVGGALGWLVGTAEQVNDRLRRLPRVTPSIEHDGWRLSLAAGGAQADFTHDIRRPIELLADSALDGKPVALVLDEFQQVAEIDTHLAGFFKTVCDDLPGIAIVFSGSRRHMMDRLFVGTGAALKNVAEPMSLEVIPEDEMVGFLRERMAAGGSEIAEPAARLLYRLVRGIPHFVQMLAASAYDLGVSPVDEDAVRLAMVEVLMRQRADLASRFEALRTNQRRLVLVLAHAPVRDLFSQRTLLRAGLAKASAERARDALRDSEVIEFDAAVGWRVSDPVFEGWLRYGAHLDLGSRIDPGTIA